MTRPALYFSARACFAAAAVASLLFTWPLGAQILWLSPTPLPKAGAELRHELAAVQSLRAALAQRYPPDHPAIREADRRFVLLSDSLAALGYSPALLRLRDALAEVESHLRAALTDQETSPGTAHYLSAVRDSLRVRYCATAPPEPYCQVIPRYPVVPTGPFDLQRLQRAM